MAACCRLRADSAGVALGVGVSLEGVVVAACVLPWRDVSGVALALDAVGVRSSMTWSRDGDAQDRSMGAGGLSIICRRALFGDHDAGKRLVDGPQLQGVYVHESPVRGRTMTAAGEGPRCISVLPVSVCCVYCVC